MNHWSLEQTRKGPPVHFYSTCGCHKAKVEKEERSVYSIGSQVLVTGRKRMANNKLASLEKFPLSMIYIEEILDQRALSGQR